VANVPTKALTPDDMEARIERLKARGRMPSLEQLVDAMAVGWREYVQSRDEGETPFDCEAGDLVDVHQPVIGHHARAKRTMSVPIHEFNRLRDERRGSVAATIAAAAPPVPKLGPAEIGERGRRFTALVEYLK
jgi:hypothetical protein